LQSRQAAGNRPGQGTTACFSWYGAVEQDESGDKYKEKFVYVVGIVPGGRAIGWIIVEKRAALPVSAIFTSGSEERSYFTSIF